MADDGYGWNEYSPFTTSSGEEKPIYLSIPFIQIMNIIHSFIVEKLEGRIDIRLQNNLITTDFIRSEGLKNYFIDLNRKNTQLRWIERYYEFHTGVPIDLVQDFPLELLSLTYRRCFANLSFSSAMSQIDEHSKNYNIFRRDEIRELSNNQMLKEYQSRLQGEAGGYIDSSSFRFLPMYLFLKFLSRPSTKPIKIFREERFSFVGLIDASNARTYVIGEYDDEYDYDEYNVGLIRIMGGGEWRFTSRIFSDGLPIHGGFSTTPVPNLIHESIQSKVVVSGVKRIPMNYFRRGIFFES